MDNADNAIHMTATAHLTAERSQLLLEVLQLGVIPDKLHWPGQLALAVLAALHRAPWPDTVGGRIEVLQPIST